MKIAIIDGNNLSFKAYAVHKESKSGLLRSSFGDPTTVIFSILRSLDKLARKTKFDKCIIAWDVGGGSKFRKKIFPEYKGNRNYKDMQDYFDELDACRDYMKVFGFTQAIVKGIEADDIIAWLATKLRQEHKVVIISDDKDYYQLVKRNIKIYRPIKEEFVNDVWVEDEFGIKPKYYSLLQAIVGEPGDNIPGIRGIGPVTAAKFIRSFGTTIRKIVKKCDNERWKDVLKDSRNQLIINHKLTRLRNKDNHYYEKDLEKLNKVLTDLFQPKKRKVRRVNRLRDNLELKSINVVYVLRRIGISIEGYSKPPKDEVII